MKVSDMCGCGLCGDVEFRIWNGSTNEYDIVYSIEQGDDEDVYYKQDLLEEVWDRDVSYMYSVAQADGGATLAIEIEQEE